MQLSLIRFNLVIPLLVSVVNVEALEESTFGEIAMPPAAMPLDGMTLSFSGDNQLQKHPRYEEPRIQRFDAAIGRKFDSKRRKHPSQNRQGRTTYVKAIVANPMLSSTQILAQKLAKEALKSQEMQETFKRLTKVNNSQNDKVEPDNAVGLNGVNAKEIVHHSKEKEVWKRHRGTKNRKHWRRRKQGGRRRHRKGRRLKRALPKKEFSKKCRFVDSRRSRDSIEQSLKELPMVDDDRIESQPSINTAEEEKSPAVSAEAATKDLNPTRERNYADDSMIQELANFNAFQRNRMISKFLDDGGKERRVYGRESMIAHLMKTTTKDPKKKNSGDQGVEYSEYYSDNDNNSPPENKAQSKLNEVTKNMRVRSIRETMNLPFYYEPRNKPLKTFYQQPVSYSPLEREGVRREHQRSIENIGKSNGYRNYEPDEQSEALSRLLVNGGDGSGSIGDIAGSIGAMNSYINDPTLENALVVTQQATPAQFSSAAPEQNFYFGDQAPLVPANNYLANYEIPQSGISEPNLLSNNVLQQPPVESVAPQQQYILFGVPQEVIASDKFQSPLHLEDPSVNSSFTTQLGGERPVASSTEINKDLGHASSSADGVVQTSASVACFGDDNAPSSVATSNSSPSSNTVPVTAVECKRTSPSAGASSPSSDLSILSPISPQPIGSNNTVPGGKSLIPAPVVDEIGPRVAMSAPEPVVKESDENWTTFRGTNQLEAIAPQTFLQMESPPSGNEQRARAQKLVPAVGNGTTSTTKISGTSSTMKGVGEAASLPPDPEEARMSVERKAKGVRGMEFHLLPMTTEEGFQIVSSSTPVNVTTMGNETKAVASEILNQIIDELEELKLDHPKNEQKEGLPCRLTGSWVTIRAGVRIDMKVTNHSVAVNLDKLAPPPTHDGLLTITWNVTGHAPFKRGGPFTLVAMDNHTKALAVFVGACKVCQGIDTIEGLWTVSREPRDCRDFQMATEVYNEIFRRTRLLSEISEVHQKHDAAVSRTLTTPGHTVKLGPHRSPPKADNEKRGVISPESWDRF